MASPFADLASFRLRWRRPTGAPADLREGLAAPADQVVVECYPSSQGQEAPLREAAPREEGARSIRTALAIGERRLRLFVTRWAVVPDGADWLDAGTSWAWNTTGERPPGIRANNTKHDAYLGPLPPGGTGEVGTFIIEQAGLDYGDGGVGAIVREAGIDKLDGRFQLPQ